MRTERQIPLDWCFVVAGVSMVCSLVCRYDTRYLYLKRTQEGPIWLERTWDNSLHGVWARITHEYRAIFLRHSESDIARATQREVPLLLQTVRPSVRSCLFLLLLRYIRHSCLSWLFCGNILMHASPSWSNNDSVSINSLTVCNYYCSVIVILLVVSS